MNGLIYDSAPPINIIENYVLKDDLGLYYVPKWRFISAARHVLWVDMMSKT